jgi:hypothetical protein
VIQMALGEAEQTSTALGVADLRYATFPATGNTTVINDPDITVAGAANIMAAVYGDDRPRFLKRVASAPVAGQFTVAAGTITCGDTDLAEKTVAYRINKSIPTCQSIGIESTNLQILDNFSFEGILAMDSPNTVTKIRIPSMKSASFPNFQIAGGQVAKFELSYTLIQAAGARYPYTLTDQPRV